MKIALIGFMGSGKTTISRVLADKLNIQRIEMDDLVLKKSGRKSISEIFAKDGETDFREMEIGVAKKLRKKMNAIISTGGGVVMNKIIIDYLKETGKVIFLETSFNMIEKRLKNKVDRPLFKDKNKVIKLFIFREKLYKEYADFIITTDNRTVEEIVISLLEII